MWDALNARMDHAEDQSAKNFDKVAEQMKNQAERFATKDAKDTRVHKVIRAELTTLDNKLSALDVCVNTGQFQMGHMEHKLTSAINALGVRLSAYGASVQAPPNVHANGASVQAPPNVPSSSVQYPGGNNSLFVRGFPKKMIARDIVQQLEGMCDALSLAHTQQGKPSLA